MGDRGVNIHRTGETARRRLPEEDGRKNRRRIRNNIIIDDAQDEDLSPTVTQEKKKKSDEELVDNFLLSVFGDNAREALEKQVFVHSQNRGISEAILALSLNKEKEYPELKVKLEELEAEAQEKLTALDQSSEFSREKLRELLDKYKQDLNSLNSDNNMSQEEQITTPPAERIESTEVALESPAEVAAETVEQINQQAETTVKQIPDAVPEIKKLVTDSQSKIQQVSQGKKLEPVDYAENELDKIGKPKSRVEINAESPEAGSKIEKIKNLIQKLNDSFSAAGVDGYAARRKALQEADDLIGIKQYQDIVLSHSKDKDKELLMNEAIERSVKELEDMLRNEELRLKNLEKLKEIKLLRDLIKILESAYGAPGVDGWSQKKSALQEAARILLNEKYAILANEITKDDLKKNKAIEEAILEAEARIRALEADGNTEKTNLSTTEDVPGVEEPAVAKVDLSKLMDESAKAVDADPNIQEARRRLDKKEIEIPESDPELATKRGDFWTALRKRGNVWSGGRYLGILKQKKETLDDFEAIKKNYDESLAVERDVQMKAFVDSLDVNLKPAERNAQIVKKYIELMQAEENQIDAISTSQEVSGMTKFKSWWKKMAKARMLIGAGLFVAGTALTAGAATGLVAGLALARGIMSGTGAYMTAESVLDTRTEVLGQKGLIDELKNIGFRRGEKGKISAFDKAQVLEELEDKEKYPLEVLEKEYARLRVLSLDKSSKLTDAGRFGAEQTLMVEAIQEAYYRRKAQQFVESTQAESPEVAKATMLAAFLSQEKSATETATSEQDKSRIKAIARNTTAAALGLGMGLLAGSKMWDKVNPEDVPDTTPETIAPVVEVPVDDVISDKGDTVWGIVEDRLAKEVPGWDQLNEAQQTRYIDYFENQVVADPSRFGITDVDHLKEGTTIHWGDLFADKNLNSGMDFVKTLTREQMQAITENNEILDQAAKHGVEITSKNVDDIIRDIKASGGIDKFLADHGLANAQAVAENAPELANTETVSDVAEKAVEAGQASTENVETLADMGDSKEIYAFTHDQGPYNANILKMAQRMGEISDQHGFVVDEVVNKVFENSQAVQEQFLHDLNPTDFTPDNNKAEVLLKMIQESGQKLADIDSMDKLKGLMASFDHLAHNPDLPVGKAFEPRLIIGEDGSEAYVFIKKMTRPIAGFAWKPKYIIDGLTGVTRTVDEDAARELLKHNTTV